MPDVVMFLVAHPDDMEPQAGGTAAKFVDAGARVHHVTMIDAPERVTERKNADKALGVRGHYLLGNHPDRAITQSAMERIELQLAFDVPDLIISMSEHDSHQHHKRTAQVAKVLTRRNNVALWTMSQAIPGGYVADRPRENTFSDISGYTEIKRNAVLAYRSQVERYPNWLRTIEARDDFMGGLVGVRQAEAFRVEKQLL